MATRPKSKSNYLEQCQEIIHKYIDAGNEWPAPMKLVAQFAYENKLWTRKPPSIIEFASRELARAARQDYVTDPQGRRVRRLHAFRKTVNEGLEYVQRTFWTDLYTAEPEDMQLALQQRRLGILGDCRQLKVDTDSYNDNNIHDAHIQLSLDFGPDVAELELPTEYNPGPLPEDD